MSNDPTTRLQRLHKIQWIVAWVGGLAGLVGGLVLSGRSDLFGRLLGGLRFGLAGFVASGGLSVLVGNVVESYWRFGRKGVAVRLWSYVSLAGGVGLAVLGFRLAAKGINAMPDISANVPVVVGMLVYLLIGALGLVAILFGMVFVWRLLFGRLKERLLRELVETEQMTP